MRNPPPLTSSTTQYVSTQQQGHKQEIGVSIVRAAFTSRIHTFDREHIMQ